MYPFPSGTGVRSSWLVQVFFLFEKELYYAHVLMAGFVCISLSHLTRGGWGVKREEKKEESRGRRRRRNRKGERGSSSGGSGFGFDGDKSGGGSEPLPGLCVQLICFSDSKWAGPRTLCRLESKALYPCSLCPHPA